jgi:phosphoserine phosphatase
MEINKLRQRLKNVGRNATEYRMTIAEATALLAEFEELEKKLAEKPITVTVISAPKPQSQIFDGGTF